MTVLLECAHPAEVGSGAPVDDSDQPSAVTAGPALEIGLVNNMPDTALLATERQFAGLLGRAAGDRPVRLRLLSLPSVARGAEAAAHIARSYAPLDSLTQRPPDALIVTGCEPRAGSLRDEPFWPGLTGLVDWAEQAGLPTLWSCLAAHAAVLHRDGILRRRLPEKRSGLFANVAATRHPLLEGAPVRLDVPHSRWNDLAEPDLVARGYTVLTRSPEAGVDLFVKQDNSLAVFFQGHPEYDLDSIAREYRRDVARFLRGERSEYPAMPHGYFDEATMAALSALRARAEADRGAVGLGDLPRRLGYAPGVAEAWQNSVLPVFRNWLALVAARRP